MKIIRTASYKKLAGVDPYSVGQIALGVAMAARDAFNQSFLALEKVGSMLSSRGRTNSETISEAMEDISDILGLCDLDTNSLNEGNIEILHELTIWLDLIREERDLEDQWLQEPHDPEGGINV